MRTWTTDTATRHKVQTMRTLAFLAAWGAGQRDADHRTEVARTIVRNRIRQLSADLLADPRFSTADTAPMYLGRP